MRVVSVMAHQDDEMRCLGTMLKCKARGDTLSFITLTDGSKGFVHNPTIARDEAAAIRDREMRSLADALGATYWNLGEEDEYLYDTHEVRLNLIEALRACRAEVIFTHYAEDYNLDHTTVHALVRHCAMQACLPVLPTESEPLGEHPAIFMCDPMGAFSFTPSHFVDITNYHAEKVRLLQLHQSQEQAMQQALGSGMDALSARIASFRGEQVGCDFAEAFLPMPSRGALKAFSVLP